MMVSLHVGSFITGTVFGLFLFAALFGFVIIKEC